jgi:HPt (histidine-containing phosphotransfer) domain-containing protein
MEAGQGTAKVDLLDQEAIHRLHAFGGARLVNGMIDLFVRNAPGKAAEAREALECGDSAALRAALHSLKSSSGQLGASTVHRACISGEELASRGELAACAPLVGIIETDLPLVCAELGRIRPDA